MSKNFNSLNESIKSNAINFLWLKQKEISNQQFIFNAETENDIHNNFIVPIIEHAKNNPEADINLWYNSSLHSNDSIKNTKDLLSQYSTKNGINNIHLRDLLDIPFFKANQKILTEGPLYFSVDYSKLIIMLYCLKNAAKDAAIFNDFAVGFIDPQNPKIMDKDQYFDQETMQKLEKSGLVVNLCHYGASENSGAIAENQFLQVINNERTVSTLEHLVNINLIRAINIFSRTEEAQKDITPHMYQIPFKSTVEEFWSIYERKTEIRADVVGAGTKDQWVAYNIEHHGIKFLGDYIEAIELNPNEPAALDYFVTIQGVKYYRAEIIKFNSSSSLEEITRETYTRKGNTHVEKAMSLILPDDYEFIPWTECNNNETNNIQYSIEKHESIEFLPTEFKKLNDCNLIDGVTLAGDQVY